jgi:hypothetical protein
LVVEMNTYASIAIRANIAAAAERCLLMAVPGGIKGGRKCCLIAYDHRPARTSRSTDVGRNRRRLGAEVRRALSSCVRELISSLR